MYCPEAVRRALSISWENAPGHRHRALMTQLQPRGSRARQNRKSPPVSDAASRARRNSPGRVCQRANVREADARPEGAKVETAPTNLEVHYGFDFRSTIVVATFFMVFTFAMGGGITTGKIDEFVGTPAA